MDKFGIFKLLNSFLGAYEQNKSNFDTSNAQKNGSQKNPLSDILTALSNKSTQSNQDIAKPTPQKTSVPLQSSMLSTMNSHDEFIKRVKEKNNASQLPTKKPSF